MSEPRVVGVISQQGNDLSALCNAEADAVGMPPRVLVACAIAESNIDEHAERWGVWPDVSFGAFQQTVAYAPIGDQSASPQNIALVRAALFDVATAAAIAAPQLGGYWSLYHDGKETLGRYNWPAVGYEGNPNAANIDRAWDASAAYVEAPVSTLTYDPATPTIYQTNDWSCSCASTAWALIATGHAVTYPEIEARMLAAGLVTPELGLLDGSGAGLQGWLQSAFGLTVERMWPGEWDELTPWCGGGPILLGGMGWNHWSAARGGDWAGMVLANPAPAWQGVSEHLEKAEWDAYGPWACLYIPAGASEEEVPVDDSSRAYVQQVAQDEILRNIDKALAYGMDPVAREALEAGARPAATTLAEGRF